MSNWSFRILQSGTTSSHRITQRTDRLFLSGDRVQVPLPGVKFFPFALQHFRNRDAGPFGDDFGDVFTVDFFFQQ